VDGGMFPDNSLVLWLKMVPLKINLFAKRLLLNRVPTKDNLSPKGFDNQWSNFFRALWHSRG